MLERNHYRKTSAGPVMCRLKTRCVSLRFRSHPGVWGRPGQECFCCRTDGCGGFSPAAKVAPEARLPSSVGSGRLRLWVRLFLAKVCVLMGMYPARPNGNRYSLRKAVFERCVLHVGPLGTAPWVRLGGDD